MADSKKSDPHHDAPTQHGTTQFEQDKKSENRSADKDSPQDTDGRAAPGSSANPPEKSGAGTPMGRIG